MVDALLLNRESTPFADTTASDKQHYFATTGGQCCMNHMVHLRAISIKFVVIMTLQTHQQGTRPQRFTLFP